MLPRDSNKNSGRRPTRPTTGFGGVPERRQLDGQKDRDRRVKGRHWKNDDNLEPGFWTRARRSKSPPRRSRSSRQPPDARRDRARTRDRRIGGWNRRVFTS